MPDDLAQAMGDGNAFQLPPFLAASYAGRCRVVVELLVEEVRRAVGGGFERMTALAAQMVGELVGGDGEQVGLQFAAFIEVGQAIEETDESLLHHVLAA